ncbi:MAG: AAA family ATPase [Arenicellales bacterium]
MRVTLAWSQVSDYVEAWLDQIGLGRYRDLFADHDIGWELIPDLDHATLKDIGIASAGHRLRIIKAARALRQQALDQPPAIRPEASRPTSGRDLIEAERRQLTVMFCDLAGSTELSQRLDPEDLRDVNRAFQDACKEAVERFDGYVARYMGDGVLAYFGYPRAHEDSAERAILAGLTVVDMTGTLGSGIGAEKGVRLSVRVTIATGPVVVGDLIGEGASQERAVVGETPNLAAHLQSLTAPDTVTVASSTRALCIGRFEFADLGAHAIKGIAQPVHIWRAISPTMAESRFEITRTSELNTFQGREDEIELALDRWKTARSGTGRLVVLSGEAGIGKSRFLQALRERISTDHYKALRFQCSPHRTSSALHPVINQLQLAAGFTAQDDSEARLDKLESMLARTGSTDPLTVSLLASLLSISPPHRLPRLELKPQELKEQTLQALLGRLQSLSGTGPVLLELEDAHWIDPTTQELMTLVVDAIRQLPVLMLVTCRSDFQCPWTHHSHSTVIVLDRLTADQSKAIIAGVCGGRDLPVEILEQIIAKTEGIPLFIEELTKNLLESGAVTEEDGRFSLSGRLPALAIPASLHDSLMARLDRLGPVKQLAQIGAAIGREFSFEAIRAVSGMDSDALQRDLQQLVEAGLIFPIHARHKVTYQFKHALVQDAAYASVLKRSRRKLHANIAGILVDQFPDVAESQPEMLARHWTEGGMLEEAVPCWLTAGKRAGERFANAEATSHLSRGLELLESLAGGQERDQLELELRVALGTVLRMSVGPGADATQENYSKAVELCDRLPESPEQFAAMWGKWVNAMNFKLELGLEWTNRLQTLATKLDDAGFSLQAHHARWTTLFHLGRFAEALTHIEQGLDFYDEQAHRSHAALYGGHDPRVCGRGFAAHALWMLGYPAQSLRYARQCADWGEQLRQIGSTLHVIETHLLLYQFRREPEQLGPWIDKLERICAENDLPEYEGKLSFNKGWLLASRGQTEAGVDLMRAGLEKQRTVGSLEDIPMFSEKLASVLCDTGCTDEALDHLLKAVEVAESHSLRYWLAEVHRRRGVLLERVGRVDAARESYRTALRTARRQKARMLQLRAAMSLARRDPEGRKGEPGADLLNPLLSGLTEELDCVDIREARALVAALRATD